MILLPDPGPHGHGPGGRRGTHRARARAVGPLAVRGAGHRARPRRAAHRRGHRDLPRRRGGCTPRPCWASWSAAVLQAPAHPRSRRSTCSSPRSTPKGQSRNVDLENAETFGVGEPHRAGLEGPLRHLQLHRVRPLHLPLPGQHERQGAGPEVAHPAPAGAALRGGARAARGRAGRRRAGRRPSVGDVIHDNVLWACTTCRWCVDACPVFIEHVPKIVDMRRCLVLTESRVPGRAAAARSATWRRNGNPWQMSWRDARATGPRDLGVRQMAERPRGRVPLLGRLLRLLRRAQQEGRPRPGASPAGGGGRLRDPRQRGEAAPASRPAAWATSISTRPWPRATSRR